MIKGLLREMISHGDRGAVVPFSRIDDLKKELIELKNEEFHTNWLDRMADWMGGDSNKFIPSDMSFLPRSMITVIIPSPKVMLQFHYRDQPIQCVVPPHYTNWDLKNNHVLQYLNDYLTPHGYSVTIARTLPQKLLAVHCGLGLYGRNNICYHDEFGSYMQIMSYFSDMPCDDTQWLPIRRMEICETCRACVTSCPTGAIDSNRQLINSDRCITFMDDLPSEEFPDWIHQDAHNSIVGCTKCQDCCPGNAHHKNNVKMGVTFTEEETEELLKHKSDERYTDSLIAKIDATGILPEYSKTTVLSRNLAVLLHN